MKKRRSPLVLSGPAAFFLLACLIVAPALLSAAPPKAGPARILEDSRTVSNRRGASAQGPISDSAPAQGREVADAHPSAVPGAGDLLLPKDGERKAGALAYFAQGLLLEDAAENDSAVASFRK